MCAGFPAGVSFVVGGQQIPVFYTGAIVASGLWIATLPRSSTGAESHKPGSTSLVVFVVWTTVMTAIGPALFHGMEVLLPRGGIDEQVARPSQLAYNISNLAQLIYLALGLSVTLFVASRRRLPAHVIGIPLGIITLLSSWRLSARIGIPFPEGFFDNTNRTFIESTAGGVDRFRGVFVEPSDLGTASVVAAVFFIRFAAETGGARRALCGAIALMAILNAAVSTSGTAVVASIAIVVIVAGYSLITWISGVTIAPAQFLAGIVGMIILTVAIPRFYGATATIIEAKMGSGSFNARAAADEFSLGLLERSYYLGVGLGSNRPSSFWPMLLSCVGLIGTMAFLAALITLARHAWRRSPQFRPTIWAIVAMFVCKSFAGPAMSDPFIWLGLGILAHAAWLRELRPDPDALEDRSQADAEFGVRYPLPDMGKTDDEGALT